MDMEGGGENLPRRRLSGQVGLKTSSSTGQFNGTPKATEAQVFTFSETTNLPSPPESPVINKEVEQENRLNGLWRSGILVFGAIILFGFYAATWVGNLSQYSIGMQLSSDDIASHHRALAEAGITHYELIPDLKSTREHIGRVLDSAGAEQLLLSISILDTIHELELTRADDLLALDYHHVLISDDGSEVKDLLKPDCIYRASIKGDSNSFGSVSLCDGQLEAIMFHRHSPVKEFAVTPLSTKFHVFYRHLAGKRYLRTCPEKSAPTEINYPERLLDEKSDWIPIGNRNKTVKLLIVNDSKRVKKLGSRTQANTLTIVNAINAFYSTIYSSSMYGVRFQLLPQISFAPKDPWNVPMVKGEVDSQSLLDKFYLWKKSAKTRNADIVHLFSGQTFENGYVGRSAQAGSTPDGVCSDRNVGVSQMTGFDLSLYAKIGAHEFGHSISLVHDDTYTDPKCKADSNTFMWSGISLDEGTKFTSCSLKTLKDFFDGKSNYPYQRCLEDQ